MSEILFWDVDTQYDFMADYGRVYVPGAKEIWGQLKRLTDYAREKDHRIFGSVDDHMPGDAQLSRTPDLRTTFPPHCMKGSPGCSKIEATQPKNPYWVERWVYDPAIFQHKVLEHEGEAYILKQWFDPFTNPNTERVLDLIAPRKIVVYGVAEDVAVADTIRGMLARWKHKIFLVQDATRPMDPGRAAALRDEWRSQGVVLASTDDVVERGLVESADGRP